MPWYIVQVKTSGIVGETTDVDSLRKVFDWTKEHFERGEIINSPSCYACLSKEPWWGEYMPGDIPNDHSFLIKSVQVRELQELIGLRWRIPNIPISEMENQANALLEERLKDVDQTFELGLYGD
jgi:hypothetical protein